MKISIITVCLNSSKTIKRNLESVKNQSFKNLEHIIIDGGSTDGTHEIIHKYKSSIHKILIEKDKGIYDAMNKGLKRAQGEIICFLNSDDFYSSKNIIKEVVSMMIRMKIDALYGDVAYFRKNNKNKIIRRFSSSLFKPERMKYGIMPAHPALFLKNNIIKQSGLFKIYYKISGDFEYILRIFTHNNIRYFYLAKIIVYMQIGGISTRGIRSYLLSNKEILRACKENGLNTNIFLICLRYIYKILEMFKK